MHRKNRDMIIKLDCNDVPKSHAFGKICWSLNTVCVFVCCSWLRMREVQCGVSLLWSMRRRSRLKPCCWRWTDSWSRVRRYACLSVPQEPLDAALSPPSSLLRVWWVTRTITGDKCHCLYRHSKRREHFPHIHAEALTNTHMHVWNGSGDSLITVFIQTLLFQTSPDLRCISEAWNKPQGYFHHAGQIHIN